jgi:hypothetical protein
VIVNWTKRKAIIAGILLPIVEVLVFCAAIIIDGEAYDRWNLARHLRDVHRAWIHDGSPEHPDVSRYAGPPSWGTTFVYTTSHVINGRSYTGLFAHRSYPRFGTYAITRSGTIVVIDDDGDARFLRIHKTRAGAW